MKSNCLFEALKAKIKDPKNVKIHLYPPRLNHGEFHFYWTNGDKVYHYTYNNKKEHLWFNGNIKEYRLSFFYSLLGHKMYASNLSKKQALHLSKKYHLPFTEGDIENIWFNEEND